MTTTRSNQLTRRTTHPKASRTLVAAVLSAAISLGTLGLSASPADALYCGPNDPKPICKPAPPLFTRSAPSAQSTSDVRPG